MPVRRGKKDPHLPRGITKRVTKTGETVYRVRVSYQGRQYEIAGHLPNLQIAREVRDIALGDIATGRFVPPGERRRMLKARREAEQVQGTTVREWAERWLDEMSSGLTPRSPGTTASYASTLRVHVLNQIGDKRLVDVTTKDVEALIAKAGESGPSAARNAARTVRTMLNAAVKAGAGGLTANPVQISIGKFGSRTRGDDEVPDADEVRALVAAMPADLQLSVWLAALLGLRKGELLGAQRRDVLNLNKPGMARLKVERQWASKSRPPGYSPPKDDSFRTLAIPQALVPIIAEHLQRYVDPEAEAPLFPSPLNRARPVSHNEYGRKWSAARDQVRPGLALHSLRHFGLTEYARQGATPAETQRRGGHRDPESANKYQHGATSRDHELSDKLGAAILGGSDE